MPAAMRAAARSILIAAAAASAPLAEQGPAVFGDALELFQVQVSARAIEGSARPRPLEAALEPLLAAVPRNALGRIDAPAVRYALHRLFHGQRGWRVDGLDPEGRAWNTSGLAGITALRRLPVAALASMLAHWEEKGLDADEVALLASIVEREIHGEAAERLRAVYKLRGLPTNAPVDEQQVAPAVDFCFASYVIGREVTARTEEELLAQYSHMSDLFPEWNETRKWIHGLVASRARAGALSFADASSAMEAVGDGQGRFQDRACRAMKTELVSMEDAGTGRVRLADFYGGALGGKWQFQESVGYLRQNGALDEGNPGNVRVIIPNYVNGLSNCVGSSEYHSVCCISECEDLRGHVERALGRPDGSPEEIAAVVSALPSATSPARGTMEPSLMLRLRRIAADNGGQVPVYGRLFAQWMHHAYPRECEYPHLAGKTSPLDLYDMEQAGLEVLAAPDEMQSRASEKKRKTAPVESVPWVHREELLGAQGASDSQVPPLFLPFHALVFACTGAGLAWLARLVPRGAPSRKSTEAFLQPSIV